MASVLDRKTSVGVGVATMGLVWGVYNQVCPKVADLRASRSGDAAAAASEKTARWTAGMLVVGVSLLTRDATVFILGGTAVVAFSWMHRHANMVNPNTGASTMPTARRTVHPGDPVGNSMGSMAYSPG